MSSCGRFVSKSLWIAGFRSESADFAASRVGAGTSPSYRKFRRTAGVSRRLPTETVFAAVPEFPPPHADANRTAMSSPASPTNLSVALKVGIQIVVIQLLLLLGRI